MVKSIAFLGTFLAVVFITSLPIFALGKSPAEAFVNPAKLDQAGACTAQNIDAARFGISYTNKSYSENEKIKICQGIELFLEHSQKAEAHAGTALHDRMHTLWNTFVTYQVQFMPLPKKKEYTMFIASAAYPRNVRADRYQAAIYIPAERVDDDLFFYAFWHELQHIQDLQIAWEKYQRVTNYDLEFNGFYMASLLAEVYRPSGWLTGQPAFWKDEWRDLPAAQQNALRSQAIDQYIMSNAVLKDTWDKKRADYDFTLHK